MALTLTVDERSELARRVRSLKIRTEAARRARVILLLADGASYSAIEGAVPCYRDYINRWRRRFLEDRLDGLRARYRGRQAIGREDDRVLRSPRGAAGSGDVERRQRDRRPAYLP